MKTRRFEPWLYCAPSLVAIALVALVPLGHTIYLAFTNARLGFVSSAEWVGLRNFGFLLQDSDWWLAVTNTLIFSFVSVSLELMFGLILALLLNSTFRGRAGLRAAALIPWAIPSVVSARMWAWMFNDIYGLANEWLLRLGWIKEPWAWLASPSLSMMVMVAVDVWKTTPFAALLLLAGLQGIPKSLYEAARVDGVPYLSQLLYITLPLLKPTILVTALFRLLDTLRIFDLPYVLTSNSKDTMMMSVYARQQLIDFQDIGYGSAASVLIFSVIAIIAVIYLAVGRVGLDGGRA